MVKALPYKLPPFFLLRVVRGSDPEPDPDLDPENSSRIHNTGKDRSCCVGACGGKDEERGDLHALPAHRRTAGQTRPRGSADFRDAGQ